MKRHFRFIGLTLCMAVLAVPLLSACSGANGTNGSTGATGPAGSAISWSDVTDTSVQAVPNAGYMADSSSQVTVTLPLSTALQIGDTIQVSGAGTGGWKIAQNSGQTIMTKNIPGGIGAVWTARNPAEGCSVVSSSDGTKLFAGACGGAPIIFASIDSGATWTSYGIPGPTGGPIRIAASSDGSKLIAAGTPGDFIATSIDSGATWTINTSAPLVAGAYFSASYSSDGIKAVAVAQQGGISGVYISLDSGMSWTVSTAPTGTNWSSVASSADGSQLAAAVNGGQIYTSSDFGGHWIARDTNRNWSSIASSSDGTKLVAAKYGGQIYTSTDSGTTWTAQATNANWTSVASSSDGTKLVAADGQIWTSTPNTTVGTAGSISGGQYDAIELQFIGNNTFDVLSHEGYLTMQ